MAKVYGNRWRNVGSLSEGGQGLVFRLTDTTGQHSGEWALKRLKNKDRVARFQQEVEILRRLDHENIVELIDANVQQDGGDEVSYLVMPIAQTGLHREAQHAPISGWNGAMVLVPPFVKDDDEIGGE